MAMTAIFLNWGLNDVLEPRKEKITSPRDRSLRHT